MFSVGIWAVRQPRGDLHAGGWWRLRIQIFPDGRCGIAVNGLPVVLFQSRLELDRPMRVNLSGNSVGTKMLVGPLQVWTGVKSDIAWSVLDSAGASSRQPSAISRQRLSGALRGR